MANPLTATSLKSSLLYLLMIAFSVVAVTYYLFYTENSIALRFHRQAFKMNFAALQNGIKFAQIRYHTAKMIKPSGHNFDLWQRDNVGLDYNQFGNPIGTSITDPEQKMPLTAENCQEIWQFVLGPIQPELKVFSSETHYWTSIEPIQLNPTLEPQNYQCAFRAPKVTKSAIIYDAKTGKVILLLDY